MDWPHETREQSIVRSHSSCKLGRVVRQLGEKKIKNKKIKIKINKKKIKNKKIEKIKNKKKNKKKKIK